MRCHLKITAGQGFSEEQKRFLVKKLLALRDSIVKDNMKLNPEEIPFLTDREIHALQNSTGHWGQLNKVSGNDVERFLKLGLIEKHEHEYRMTKRGEVAFTLHGERGCDYYTDQKRIEELIPINVPEDGFFKVKRSVCAVNRLLNKLNVSTSIGKTSYQEAAKLLRKSGIAKRGKQQLFQTVVKRYHWEQDRPTEYKTVQGEAINVPGYAGMKFFIAQDQQDRWQLYESRTGRYVGEGSKSRERAVLSAKDILDRAGGLQTLKNRLSKVPQAPPVKKGTTVAPVLTIAIIGAVLWGMSRQAQNQV